LTKDLGRDQVISLGNDYAGVDQTQVTSAQFCFLLKTVSRDSWLVADDRAAATHKAIEKRGFAHVGPANDGNGRRRECFGYAVGQGFG